MKTQTTKTHRKPVTNSEAFQAYLNGTRCSVPQIAWQERKEVKAKEIQFVIGKDSGITFRV